MTTDARTASPEHLQQAQAFCEALGADAAPCDVALAAEHFAKGMASVRDVAPALALDMIGFAEHVALCADEMAPLDSLQRLYWGDLWVVFGAVSGNRDAWRVLDSHYFAESVRVLGRLKLSRDKLDEVSQHTRVRLFSPGPRGVAKLRQYRARGALGAWLKMVVTRDAIDMLSKKKVELPAFSDDFWSAIPASQDDNEMALLRREYGAQLKRTVEAVVEEMPDDARSMLRYHLVEGLTIDDIAVIVGIHRATVARRIGRARDAMARATRERMREHLQMTASQLTSVMRLIDTQIELSLYRLL